MKALGWRFGLNARPHPGTLPARFPRTTVDFTGLPRHLGMAMDGEVERVKGIEPSS